MNTVFVVYHKISNDYTPHVVGYFNNRKEIDGFVDQFLGGFKRPFTFDGANSWRNDKGELLYFFEFGLPNKINAP